MMEIHGSDIPLKQRYHFAYSLCILKQSIFSRLHEVDHLVAKKPTNRYANVVNDRESRFSIGPWALIVVWSCLVHMSQKASICG